MNRENLWAYGISGEIPIICEYISSIEDVEALVEAKKFLEFKNFKFDLVLIADEPAGYNQPIFTKLKEKSSQHVHVFGKDFLGDDGIKLFREVTN